MTAINGQNARHKLTQGTSTRMVVIRNIIPNVNMKMVDISIQLHKLVEKKNMSITVTIVKPPIELTQLKRQQKIS